MSELLAEIELARTEAPGPAPRDPGFHLQLELGIGPELAVLLGPSGAGKSTLLLALLGALRPARGRIRLGGETLFDSRAGVDQPIRRRGIGIVFQDALLFPHLDGRDNVAFGMRGRTGRARQSAAELELEQTGAAHLARRLPSEMSGGERQRVALARALAAEPRLLLLDEPFSALDAAARESLGALLVELQRVRRIPFLHVTHDLDEALRLASHALVIEAGRLVASGPPETVLSARFAFASRDWAPSDNLLFASVRRAHPGELRAELDLDGLTVHAAGDGWEPGARVALRLHADEVLIALPGSIRSSARNVLAGRVRALRPIPAGVEVEVEVAPALLLRALVTVSAVSDLGLEPGLPVHLLFKATALRRVR